MESMTLDIERGAHELIEKIDGMGGALAAIESGFVQRAIGDAAYAAQQAIESKKSIVVGVNDFVDDTPSLPILKIDDSVERDQLARLRAFREKRRGDFRSALASLDRAARDGVNVMPWIVDCVRSECTVGEIVATLKRTFGEHADPGF
jgi:methylmalonyl-CoA mutase N-terminal domain/subunit